MLYFTIAVLLGLAIISIFKASEQVGRNRLALITINYIVCIIIATILLVADKGIYFFETLPPIPVSLWVLGLINGATFVLSFFLLSWGTREAGVAISTGIHRTAVVFPVFGAWFLWAETPTFWQATGLVLAGLAFLGLVIIKKKPNAAQNFSTKTGLVLALLFISGGTGDMSMKFFDVIFASHFPIAFYTLLVFTAALIFGVIMFYVDQKKRTRRPALKEHVVWGVTLGVVNYFGVFYMLKAVAELKTVFVFPAHGVAVLLGGAILGVFVWKEELSMPNKMALAAAALALPLLYL